MPSDRQEQPENLDIEAKSLEYDLGEKGIWPQLMRQCDGGVDWVVKRGSSGCVRAMVRSCA